MSSAIPVIVVKEGSTRRRGRDAQNYNLSAALALAEAVKSALGPKGADKMLVDTFGDVTITGDGATMLEEMEVEHPAGKIMTEAAKAQDKEVGDGTTSVVLLAGALLKEATRLIGSGVHPTIVADGYRGAALEAISAVEAMASKASPRDRRVLMQAAETAMSGSLIYRHRSELAEIAVSTALKVAKKTDGGLDLDLDDVKIDKKPGGSILDTMLVDGVALDKEVVHPAMPKRLENAKVVLLSCSLEVEKTEIDERLKLKDPELLKEFIKAEDDILREMVEKIRSVGANAVFCQKGIDDLAQYYLAKSSILAIRRVKKSDMEKLEMATGGRIVNTMEELSPRDLGRAGLIEERKIGGEKWVFLEKVPRSKTASIVIRGGSQRVVDEAERAMKDALSACRSILKEPLILAGGGAPEVEAAIAVRRAAEKVSGREQNAYQAFADALESIPYTLAENGGLDAMAMLASLRAAHTRGERNAGIDVEKGIIADLLRKGVVDPLHVKRSVLRAATEVSSALLRIDDVLAAAKMKEPKGPPPEEMY